MRSQGNNDFAVEVDGLGRFYFGRRTMQDMYRIRGEYSSMTSGNFDENGNAADFSAMGFITLKALMVSAPVGFDIDALDPLTDDTAEDKVVRVFVALRSKELSFRAQPKAAQQEAGQGSGVELGGVVSGEVQPPAD